MRKKSIVSAALALLLVLIAGSACAAYCTACGVSISDSAHLCPRCGARQMPSTSALTITRVWSNGDGTVTVRWSGGTLPCRIECVPMLSNSISDDLAAVSGMGLQPASTALFDGYAGTADRLVPGMNYWIIVRDAKGRLDYHPHIPGAASSFTDFPVDVALQLRSRRSGACEEHAAFSAGRIAADSDVLFSADVLLTYPALVSGRDFTMLLCITAPNGAVMTVHGADICLPGGSAAFHLAFCDMTAYFRQLAARFGSIPAGEYTCSLYFDGMFVSSQSFRVTN